MIKAVFFDIDNTVCNYDKAHSAAMEKLLEYGKTELCIDSVKMQHLLSEAQKIILGRLGQYSAVIHNRLVRFQCFLELMHYHDFTKALKMEHIYWNVFLKNIIPEPGLYQLLQALRAAGMLTGVGPDQSSCIQYQKLETLGILDCFSCIVTSEEAGAEKPDSRFFKLCVEKAGCLAEECVFIGDNIKKDVEGALQNGLHGVWYYPGQPGNKKCIYPVIHSYTDCLGEDGIQLGADIINLQNRRI